MQEIRRRERVIPSQRDQIMAFMRTVLPPLLARYALQLARRAAGLPQVRAVLMSLGLLALATLVVPALVVGVLAWLATGSAATATGSAVTITVLVGGLLGVLIARLYQRWKVFRLRYFR